MDIECRKRGKPFNFLVASCGIGYSYGFYRCPFCEQLHAMAISGFSIPDDILKNKEIIVIETFRPVDKNQYST